MEEDEQADFRAGRSTVDHVFRLTHVTVKRMTCDQEIFTYFVSISNSIATIKFWRALKKININLELIKTAKSTRKKMDKI